MRSTLIRSFAVAAFAVSSFVAQAAPTPSYTTFGTLAGATFGGTGIPNNAVAITTIGGFTMGLTANQRYVGPNLANNGAGTFYAAPGNATPAGSTFDGSFWNFAYYLSGDTLGYNFKLFYDVDPSAGTDYGVVTANGGGAAQVTTQDSQNLMFNLGQSSFQYATGFTAPAGTFDPNVAGQYNFALVAYSAATGAEVGRSSINVIVGQPAAVPEPATIALFGLGLFGVAATRRKSKKATRA
ncbi:MAG: PEP-CTERM sorting domain-containing protein [Rhodoferax sp.]